MKTERSGANILKPRYVEQRKMSRDSSTDDFQRNLGDRGSNFLNLDLSTIVCVLFLPVGVQHSTPSVHADSSS